MGGGSAKKYSKKPVSMKKTIQEPVKKPEPATRKSLLEPSTSRKQTVQESPAAAPAPAETSKLVPAPVSIPTKATKTAKASPAYKTKTITKKTPQISTFLHHRIIFILFIYYGIFYPFILTIQ